MVVTAGASLYIPSYDDELVSIAATGVGPGIADRIWYASRDYLTCSIPSHR